MIRASCKIRAVVASRHDLVVASRHDLVVASRHDRDEALIKRRLIVIGVPYGAVALL